MSDMAFFPGKKVKKGQWLWDINLLGHIGGHWKTWKTMPKNKKSYQPQQSTPNVLPWKLSPSSLRKKKRNQPKIEKKSPSSNVWSLGKSLLLWHRSCWLNFQSLLHPHQPSLSKSHLEKVDTSPWKPKKGPFLGVRSVMKYYTQKFWHTNVIWFPTFAQIGHLSHTVSLQVL